MSSLIQRAVQTGAIQKIYKELTTEQKLMLPYIWPLFAREEQVPKHNNWDIWIFLGGRGSGKTRAGAEWVRQKVKEGVKRIAFIGRTAADVRDIMIEGESGILSVCPPWDIDNKGHKMRKPYYEPSKRKLSWRNRAVAHMYTSKEPDMLRGPQHEIIWADELASWIKMKETFDNAILGLRLGSRPQMMVTTTPRPLKLIRDLVGDKFNYVTKSSSYRNKENLAKSWFEKLIKRYEGTRLGRQELLAEILEDNPEALFQRDNLDRSRVSVAPRDIVSVCTAIDPAATSNQESADTGIVTVGKAYKGDIGHYYILADNTCHKKPDGWAREAIMAYDKWQANALVAEVNHGGEMVEAVIRGVRWEEGQDQTRGENVVFRAVRASRGKYIRAEPVSALAEQNRLHIVGSFPELEDQMCQWSPNLVNEPSPDRLDAMVWAVTYLMEEGEPSIRVL